MRPRGPQFTYGPSALDKVLVVGASVAIGVVLAVLYLVR